MTSLCNIPLSLSQSPDPLALAAVLEIASDMSLCSFKEVTLEVYKGPTLFILIQVGNGILFSSSHDGF